MKITMPSANFWERLHLVATGVWLLLLIPALTWWRESVPFVVFMSVWANIAAHWSAYQGSRAEEKNDAE